MGVDVGLVGEVDGGRESAGSLGLAELGSWANQVRRDFAGAASAVGFFERFEEKNINVCSWFEMNCAYRFLPPYDGVLHVELVR